MSRITNWKIAQVNRKSSITCRCGKVFTSMVLALRRKVNIKVRQPLSMLMIPVVDEQQKQHIEAMRNLILTEVNVKELKFVDNAAGILVKRVKPDFKKLGPRYGKIMKQLANAITGMSQEAIASYEREGRYVFDIDGLQAVIESGDAEILSEDIPGWLVANEGRLTVALDVTLTEELQKEGYARELVNRIQNIRKQNEYEITDKIRITLAHNAIIDNVIKEYGEYIARQTLADSIVIGEVSGEDAMELDLDTLKINIHIEKA